MNMAKTLNGLFREEGRAGWRGAGSSCPSCSETAC